MEIEDLVAVEPNKFTAARAALVAELRREGKTAAAAAAGRLRKPTVPVWIVNQLARRNGDAVEAFVAAADEVRRASLGHGGSLPDATAKHRTALRSLLRRAEQVAEAGRQRRAADVMLRVSNTLLGAAADPDARAALRRGRLREELKPPGLEALLAGPPPVVDERARAGVARQRRARPAADGHPPDAGKAGRRAETRMAAARARARQAADARARRRKEAEARTRLRTAEQVEARLRRRAEKLERTAAALRGRLESVERDAVQVRAAQRQAAAELERARESTSPTKG